jgi:hypothetical protein
MDTNENDIVVALVAVGEKYVDEIIPRYNRLKRWGYNVKVLTDQPTKFEVADVILYGKRVFNYFDKLYFALELISRYNKTVIFIDGAEDVSDELIKEYTSNLTTDCVYLYNWPLGSFNQYKNEPAFEYLVKYLTLYNISIKDYPTIYEHVLVFNKTIDHELVRNELEMIQPVFDYMALLNYKLYKKPFVLGDGEGLALSIILDKTNQSSLLHPTLI